MQQASDAGSQVAPERNRQATRDEKKESVVSLGRERKKRGRRRSRDATNLLDHNKTSSSRIPLPALGFRCRTTKSS